MADLEKEIPTSLQPAVVEPARVSRAELRRTLRTGRVTNVAYLGVVAPTAAATREQVAALTVQIQALIRYTLGE